MVELHGLTIDPGEKIRGCQQLNSISIGQNTFHQVTALGKMLWELMRRNGKGIYYDETAGKKTQKTTEEKHERGVK